jgi:hypothetical protein
MRRVNLLLAVLLLAFLTMGCSRAAEIIPGSGERPTSTATSAAITTVSAQTPLLAPGALRLAGGAGADSDLPAIADADLARSVVQIKALSGGSVNAVVRSGSGVVVDTGQQLILTSYMLVDPYLANGTRAYATLAVGAATGSNTLPEFQAALVAANPTRLRPGFCQSV